MARQKGKIQVSNFTGGLVTDYHALNTPANVTTAEDNCDLDRKGSRRRRLGFDYETDFELSTESYLSDALALNYIKSYHWNSVANTGELQFLVVQIGQTLTFYDRAASPLSSGELPFSLSLNDHKAPGVADASSTGIQVASGKGYLFVVGEKINPFFITYNPDTNTITTTDINIRIRDLKEQDIVNPIEYQPSVLTAQRKYDLYNQGWYFTTAANDSIHYGSTVTTDVNVLDYYFFATGHYPPKSKPWWVGKRSAIDPGEAGYQVFDPNGMYNTVYAGNTLAPLGHYIVDPFNIDRSTISGIPGITVETSIKRPMAVAFMAGRVFFGLDNIIYYSQVITTDINVVNYCYQDADPTAEDINDLVATDGGTLTIPDAGPIFSMFVSSNTVLVFANNGIWAVSGTQPGDGFSATGYSQSRASGVIALSARTIVDADGAPTFWAKNGIYTMQYDINKSAWSALSLTDKKIQTLYDSISTLAKQFATGAYDHIRKRLIWLYHDDASIDNITDRFFYTRALNFDTQYQAFFPYTVADTEAPTPHICDIFNVSGVLLISSEEVVTDSSLVTVTDSTLADVTTINRSYQTLSGTTSDVKYLILAPDLLS